MKQYGGMLLEERRYSNLDVNPQDPEVFVTTHTYNNDGLLLRSVFPEGDSVENTYDQATAPMSFPSM